MVPGIAVISTIEKLFGLSVLIPTVKLSSLRMLSVITVQIILNSFLVNPTLSGT